MASKFEQREQQRYSEMFLTKSVGLTIRLMLIKHQRSTNKRVEASCRPYMDRLNSSRNFLAFYGCGHRGAVNLGCVDLKNTQTPQIAFLLKAKNSANNYKWWIKQYDMTWPFIIQKSKEAHVVGLPSFSPTLLMIFTLHFWVGVCMWL